MELVPEEFFLARDLKRIADYYVPPDCTDINPTSDVEIEEFQALRQPLFDVVDHFLKKASGRRRCLLLFGDSGMGKTSFLLNYYLRNKRRPSSRRRRIAIIPLGHEHADERIQEIASKSETDLFLDSLDEDPLALRDALARMLELLDRCSDFRTVLITCRSQFLASDDGRRLGLQSNKLIADHQSPLTTLYIAPFNSEQQQSYLKRRYGLLNLGKRRKAMDLAANVSPLSDRPMFLSYLSELLDRNQKFDGSFDIYRAMVDGWLTRESDWANKGDLEHFCEELAVHLVTHGINRIRSGELITLASAWGTPLSEWKMLSRSLLHRDPEGNLRFAHRSVLEYFFVKRMLEGDERCFEVGLTNEMKWFLTEMERFDLIERLAQSRSDVPPGLIQVVNSISTELLKYLQTHPNEVYKLGSRQFEELVAEMLAAYGWEIQLTPVTRDGGYDLFAISKDVAGVKTSWIIECKKYRRDRPVGIEIVRALYGVKHDKKAANAMLATTSFFTRGVHEYKASRYDLELRDYQGIVEWIRDYKLSADGRLYLRDGGA